MTTETMRPTRRRRREVTLADGRRVFALDAKVDKRQLRVGDEGGVGPEQGRTFEALVSVFGNIDSFGDRLMPGAFTDTLAQWKESGDPIPILYAHRWDDPRANIGEVLEARETDDGLVVVGLLDDDGPGSMAEKAYTLMKSRRVKQFSFAFDYCAMEPAKLEDGSPEVTEAGLPVFNVHSVKLYEVGPCLVGANPQTQLYGIKSKGQKSAIAPASTDTDTGTWDGPAQEANLSNDEGAATYRKAYAWVDPNGDPDAKASYRFIHHFVSSDGTVGAASTVACSAGIGVLNGGRGGTTIPSADRQGVYNHLARHLKDAGLDVPELKQAEPEERTLEVPAKVGRTISKATADELAAALDALDQASAKLRSLLDPEAKGGDTEEQEPGQPAQPGADETDGKSASPRATRGPAAWMTAFEAAGTTTEVTHDDSRRGDRATSV